MIHEVDLVAFCAGFTLFMILSVVRLGIKALIFFMRG